MGCIANAVFPFLPEYCFEGEGAEIEKKLVISYHFHHA